ncbi:MAG: type III-A CRISPR-associated RAMP protein Csm4 [Methanolinea sp.]|nr:type III-A CRISPR-associated RAMP protein Csm4 [Methanolinea sp.]
MLAVSMTPRSTFPESFPSHTLFGAICRAMAELGEDPGALVDAYADSPPLYVSSCFPFVGGEERVYLFPMPILPFHAAGSVKSDVYKELRKVRWVDREVFHGLAGGKITLQGLVRDISSFRLDSRAGILSSRAAAGSFAAVDIPHNVISRLSSASLEFYHARGMHFGGGGLWFLLDIRDSSWEAPVMAALRLLEDEGIGPRRSTGQGAFRLSVEKTDLPSRDAPYFATLSRFIPGPLSAYGGEIWYDLVAVRGRTRDGFAKRRVIMLSEGSVFRNTGRPFYGEIARVRENPPMVEYGIAFPVGMRCVG